MYHKSQHVYRCIYMYSMSPVYTCAYMYSLDLETFSRFNLPASLTCIPFYIINVYMAVVYNNLLKELATADSCRETMKTDFYNS